LSFLLVVASAVVSIYCCFHLQIVRLF
jgi:hypothetical protein